MHSRGRACLEQIFEECTLRIAGAMELGPLDEKKATLANKGFPTNVLEGLNFTRGDLYTHPSKNKNHRLIINKESSDCNHEVKNEDGNVITWLNGCKRVFGCQLHSQLQRKESFRCTERMHQWGF